MENTMKQGALEAQTTRQLINEPHMLPLGLSCPYRGYLSYFLIWLKAFSLPSFLSCVLEGPLICLPNPSIGFANFTRSEPRSSGIHARASAFKFKVYMLFA